MYCLIYSEDVLKSISKLQKDEKELVKNAIELCLGEYLMQKTRRCNKKRLKGSKFMTYRLHISMRYTLFYRIDNENNCVLIINLMGINQAHSKYGII